MVKSPTNSSFAEQPQAGFPRKKSRRNPKEITKKIKNQEEIQTFYWLGGNSSPQISISEQPQAGFPGKP